MGDEKQPISSRSQPRDRGSGDGATSLPIIHLRDVSFGLKVLEIGMKIWALQRNKVLELSRPERKAHLTLEFLTI